MTTPNFTEPENCPYTTEQQALIAEFNSFHEEIEVIDQQISER